MRNFAVVYASWKCPLFVPLKSVTFESLLGPALDEIADVEVSPASAKLTKFALAGRLPTNSVRLALFISPDSAVQFANPEAPCPCAVT